MTADREPVPDDLLFGYRMQADSEFASHLAESTFTTAEWDIIMSVVSFELENPHAPANATLVPETEDLATAIAATETIPEHRTQREHTEEPNRGGLLAGLVRRFGRGSSARKRTADAERLLEAYATQLEETIKSLDGWHELCEEVALRTEQSDQP